MELNGFVVAESANRVLEPTIYNSQFNLDVLRGYRRSGFFKFPIRRLAMALKPGAPRGCSRFMIPHSN